VHADIHHGDVRRERRDQLDGLLSVSGFADNGKAFPFEKRPHALANERVIIHEKYA
jgi:acetoin utilization deacetylase AcuC-like enzyme